MKKSALLILPALLAGCSYYTKAPWEVTHDLDHRYGGRPVNEFFVNYGLPVSEFAGNNGGHVYRWASLEPPPPESVEIASHQTSGGRYQITDNFNGITQMQYCELRIYTGPDDIIDHFAVAVDSVGKWTASRCSEIFQYP